MDPLERITSLVAAGQNLQPDQAAEAARLMADAEIAQAKKQAFLVAFAAKGETAEEVAAFAGAFRQMAIDPGVEAWADRAIDVCGTGGDGSSTFNISTAVSLIVAAAGVPVFKHGNRSITSKCGSADLLEGLGIRLDLSHEQLRQSLEELNFCFFFAPAFHPAFKEIMPVRKALAAEGQRSIFNLLGPLINPGRPAHQLLGVYAPEWVEPLAGALDALELSAGLVVHGQPEAGRALDELSCAGTNKIAGFGKLSQHSGALSASDAGLPECSFADLAGGEVDENLAILHSLLSGEGDPVPAGLRNSILFNAGAALWAAGEAPDLKAGAEAASTLLEEGRVARWLESAREFNAQFESTDG
ncbi:anthranilate phosphoribosyltransferase [Coraliomargarita sinensis]|uniref:Anthranilate phosphoribosyltransferase n=1 Tax=Coraliomargarita sinensis TaxID=2174842 RepID=A0A317ZGB0_9BACT|nr:anthranilate phosphoribosyltransferase [Coraliomargarita sinensis]PXA02968.1 anthranilate phosphoribosyltransferase [Coraliomargarita sinensis]